MPVFNQQPRQQLLEQAAEWLVLLSSDQANAKTQQDYQAWLQQSAEHRSTAERLQNMVDKLKELKHSTANQYTSEVINQALHEQVQFKYLPKFPTLVLLFCTVMMISVVYHLLPLKYWLADHQSSHGVWRTDLLADRSEIHISGLSTYNVDFDAKQRRVELLEGNIWVDVAKDAQRPFMIQTRFAEIEALGTRFIVHHNDDYTILTMLHSKVRLHIAKKTLEVNAGQQVVIDHTGLRSIHKIDPKVVEEAWAKRGLAVENMPLDQVLSIIDSYQSDYFYYSQAEMSRLKITAILPLDRDADAMYLLSESLPIQISQPLPFIRYIAHATAH